MFVVLLLCVVLLLIVRCLDCRMHLAYYICFGWGGFGLFLLLVIVYLGCLCLVDLGCVWCRFLSGWFYASCYFVLLFVVCFVWLCCILAVGGFLDLCVLLVWLLVCLVVDELVGLFGFCGFVWLFVVCLALVGC